MITAYLTVFNGIYHKSSLFPVFVINTIANIIIRPPWTYGPSPGEGESAARIDGIMPGLGPHYFGRWAGR
jgi:hypothetical protein